MRARGARRAPETDLPSTTDQRPVVAASALSDQDRRGPTWPAYLASVVLTALATTFVLKLWRADWHVPFFYSGDALAVAAHFKTLLETGWYESQPLLGAPAGQVYHDFPTADNLNFAAGSVLGALLGDWAVAMNVYYVVGFLLCAVGGLFFLLRVGVSRPVGVALSVLFALAPYHFVRNENHLWLSSYFFLPIALWVVWLVATGRPVWLARAGARNRLLGALTGRGAGVAVGLALAAASSTYYAFFAVVLLAVAGVAALWRHRSVRRFVGAVAAGGVLAASAVANMLPDTVYAWQNGESNGGLTRSPVETEYYAFKLTQLLLPIPGHRVDAFAQLRQFYDRWYPFPSETPVLGAVAAVGFVALLVLGLVALFGRRRAGVSTDAVDVDRFRTLRALSALSILAFLFGTLGGVSSLLSFLTSDLRGWNRLSIVIALFGLAAVGLLVDLVVRRAATRLPARARLLPVAASALVAVVLLGGGVYDQTNGGAVPTFEANDASFSSDQAFFASVEQTVGAGADVLQLPYVDFPEASTPNGLSYTEFLKPYLHTQGVHWSAGGIKGRATSEWAQSLEEYDGASVADQLAVVGFSAVLVDTTGYADQGDEVTASLTPSLGAPVAESDGGRWALYTVPTDLRDAAAALPAPERERLTTLITDPPIARPGNTDVASGGDDTVNSVVLQNDREVTVPATLDIDLQALVPGVTSVVVEGPGVPRRVVAVVDGVARVSIDLTVRPGVTTLDVAGSADGGSTTLGQAGAVGYTSIALFQPTVESLDLTP